MNKNLFLFAALVFLFGCTAERLTPETLIGNQYEFELLSFGATEYYQFESGKFKESQLPIQANWGDFDSEIKEEMEAATYVETIDFLTADSLQISTFAKTPKLGPPIPSIDLVRAYTLDGKQLLVSVDNQTTWTLDWDGLESHFDIEIIGFGSSRGPNLSRSVNITGDVDVKATLKSLADSGDYQDGDVIGLNVSAYRYSRND